MHRWVPAVGLVALVLLAGCGGLFGSDGPSAGDTSATLTPAPVPTDAPLSDLPSGLSKTGVTNAFALANAHTEALANTSFTVRVREMVTAENETRLSDSTTVKRVAANHSRATQTTTYNESLSTGLPPATVTAQWFNGTHSIIRRRTPNGTDYSSYRPQLGSLGSDLSRHSRLQSYYIEAKSGARVASTPNGSIRLRVTTTSDRRADINVTRGTVSLRLTETGRVERYRVEYTGHLVDDPDTTVEGVRVVRFTTLDETTVNQPGWVSTARNANAGTTQAGYGWVPDRRTRPIRRQ